MDSDSLFYFVEDFLEYDFKGIHNVVIRQLCHQQINNCSRLFKVLFDKCLIFFIVFKMSQ